MKKKTVERQYEPHYINGRGLFDCLISWKFPWKISEIFLNSHSDHMRISIERTTGLGIGQYKITSIDIVCILFSKYFFLHVSLYIFLLKYISIHTQRRYMDFTNDHLQYGSIGYIGMIEWTLPNEISTFHF